MSASVELAPCTGMLLSLPMGALVLLLVVLVEVEVEVDCLALMSVVLRRLSSRLVPLGLMGIEVVRLRTDRGERGSEGLADCVGAAGVVGICTPIPEGRRLGLSEMLSLWMAWNLARDSADVLLIAPVREVRELDLSTGAVDWRLAARGLDGDTAPAATAVVEVEPRICMLATSWFSSLIIQCKQNPVISALTMKVD